MLYRAAMIVRWGLDFADRCSWPSLRRGARCSSPPSAGARPRSSGGTPFRRRAVPCRGGRGRAGAPSPPPGTPDADGLVALGRRKRHRHRQGGLRADLDVPVVSIPTTYGRALMWTQLFGTPRSRDPHKGGGDGRARGRASSTSPSSRWPCPSGESWGTALNALTHCAEALYVRGTRRRRPTRDCARGRRGRSPRGGRRGARRRPTTARRGGACWRAPCTRVSAARRGWACGARDGAGAGRALRPLAPFHERGEPRDTRCASTARVPAAALRRSGRGYGQGRIRSPGWRSWRRCGRPHAAARLRRPRGGAPRARRGGRGAPRAPAKANPRPAAAEAILGLLRELW